MVTQFILDYNHMAKMLADYAKYRSFGMSHLAAYRASCLDAARRYRLPFANMQQVLSAALAARRNRDLAEDLI